MIGNVSAQIALLSFSLAIVAGIYAGNSPTTVLLRACAALAIAFAVGQVVASAMRLALREHLQRRKVSLDRRHVEALSAGADAAE